MFACTDCRNAYPLDDEYRKANVWLVPPPELGVTDTAAGPFGAYTTRFDILFKIDGCPTARTNNEFCPVDNERFDSLTECVPEGTVWMMLPFSLSVELIIS